MHYDHIVIGSGIVGLSTAIELKERFPAKRVLVLERSLFPYGASTRNAGFACMGSFTELLDDLKHHSEEAMVALFLERKRGLDILRQRLGDDTIGYRERGSYELISESELPLLEHMPKINRALKAATGQNAFCMADEKLPGTGFDSGQVAAMIKNLGEGELHSGKMMRALTDLAIARGVELKTGAQVLSFKEEKETVALQVADPVRGEAIPLQCGKLFICTNAFTSYLLPGAELNPGRGQVLITDVIKDLPFQGIYHFNEGYYYFREIDGRVLFGGGRNIDFEGETTTDIALNEKIQADLEHKLRTLILPGSTVGIAQRWSGIMAFGRSKRPIVRQFSPKVFGAFRMGGMGVALGSAAAQELANLVAE